MTSSMLKHSSAMCIAGQILPLAVATAAVWPPLASAQQPRLPAAPMSRAPASDWREVNPGDATQPVMSIDLNSLARIGLTLRVRSLLDLPEPSIDAVGRQFSSALQQLHISCDSGQVAVETLGYYVAGKGRGVFMDNPGRRQMLAFNTPQLDTPTATVVSLVCEIAGNTNRPGSQSSAAVAAAPIPSEEAAPGSGATSTWQLVNPGDPHWPAYYIEAFSIGMDGSHKTVRTLAENKSGVPSMTGKAFKSSLGLLYVDCTSRQVGVRAYGIYAGPVGTGTFVQETEPADRITFGTPQEGTPVAKIAARVCGFVPGR